MTTVGLELHACDVSVRWPEAVALSSVDVRIDPGERVALVGPSGSGKTTLLRVLGASLAPTSGTVSVGGRAIAAMSDRELRSARSEIGFVHQDLALLPNVRVSQNVIAGRAGRMSTLGSLRAFVWPSRPMLERAYALLERVGVGDKTFIRTDRLSGGQRQRVAIARALYQEPRVLLADEPVSSVDPERARDTVELLTSISAEDGFTMCASLHNVDLARELFPRLIGLRDGAVVFDLPAGEVSRELVESLYSMQRGDAAAVTRGYGSSSS